MSNERNPNRWPAGVPLENFPESAQDFAEHPENYGYKDDPAKEVVFPATRELRRLAWPTWWEQIQDFVDLFRSRH
jgi:hypothetical protein